MASDTTTEGAAAPEAAPEIPAGAALDWTEPALGEPAAPEAVADDVDESVLNLPLARKGYILGLEAEMVFYGGDAERKAAITAELDRVRGGNAVAPEKETR